MVFNRFRIAITWRVILLALTVLLLFVLLETERYRFSAIIIGLLVILEIVLLIRYVEQTNRKLTQFFQSIRHADFSSSFSDPGLGKSFEDLSREFNQVIEAFRKYRTEKEESFNYLQTVIQHVSIGILVFRRDGQVDVFNQAIKKMLKIKKLRNIHDLSEAKEDLPQTLMNLKAGDSTLIKVFSESELLQLSIIATEFRMRGEDYILVSIQDISTELDEKEIESWQKMIRVLTHEIMNSMTPIITLVTTITRLYRNKETGELKQPSEIQTPMIEKTLKGLDLIESRGQGLIHFVQNYRDVTRLPKPDFKILNVRDMFQGIKLMFDEQLIQNGVKLNIDCHPSLFLNADGKLLEQVIINLVKNAIEAFEDAPDPTITMSAQSNNNQIIMEIADNGKGIPPDMLENIFVPFFTTKEKGSGIGLSLSRQIIRLHGGTMNVQSEPFSRTVFTIKI